MDKKAFIASGALLLYFKQGLNRDFDPIIYKYAGQYGIDPDLVKAIIWKESNFRDRAHAKTDKEDSRGLMQINAPTARALGYDPDDLWNPDTNIQCGCKLLAELKDRYDTLFDIISAYNAGRPIWQNFDSYVWIVFGRYLALKGDTLTGGAFWI